MCLITDFHEYIEFEQNTFFINQKTLYYPFLIKLFINHSNLTTHFKRYQ